MTTSASPTAASFFDSYECRSGVHCRACRDPVDGQAFRQAIATFFGMPSEWVCGHVAGASQDEPLPQPVEDVATAPNVAAPVPAVAAADPGGFGFIYRRQEICLACGQFDARQGNCTVAGVTCGPCYRKVRTNRCPAGSCREGPESRMRGTRRPVVPRRRYFA